MTTYNFQFNILYFTFILLKSRSYEHRSLLFKYIPFLSHPYSFAAYSVEFGNIYLNVYESVVDLSIRLKEYFVFSKKFKTVSLIVKYRIRYLTLRSKGHGFFDLFAGGKNMISGFIRD